jgi:hypothetical protein
MKISEVTIEHLKDYANVFHNEDDDLFANILLATKAYIRGYTGLDDISLDLKDDLTIALMILAMDMYDIRTFNIESAKANLMVQSILQMHSINLL